MPPKSSLEREIKLAAPAGFRLPDLNALDPELSAAPEEQLVQTAVYYDTADLRLARWDCGLRHRSSDGWTLKLGDAGAGRAVERREFRLAGPAAEPPAAALDLVQAISRGSRLEPVARLQTERRRVVLLDQTGEPRIEVTLDEVAVLEGRAPGARFREVEVELVGRCRRRWLKRVLARLEQAGVGPTHRVAKHARALGLEAGIEPELPLPVLGADSATIDVLRRALAGPVSQLVCCDPGVRVDEDVEDVHRMRVATRRLRSHLRTFRPQLDREFTAGLQAELCELGALLGAVRDADVLGERLRRTAEALPESEQRAAKELRELLLEARRLDRARLLEHLRSERHRALLERLIAAGREPRLTCDPAAPAAETLAPRVWWRWRRLRRAARRLGPHPADADLHRVRIAAKHARYAAEALAPVFGPRVAKLARAMRPLQQALGDHQDAVVAAEWLREAAAGVSPEAAFGAGRLAIREQRAARQALRSWKRAWRRARKRARRSRPQLRR